MSLGRRWAQPAEGNTVGAVQAGDEASDLPLIDLRQLLPTVSARSWFFDRATGDRSPIGWGDIHLVLVEEPNPYKCLAVVSGSRRLGFVEGGRAGMMRPYLKALGPAAFVVRGSFDGWRANLELPAIAPCRALAEAYPYPYRTLRAVL